MAGINVEEINARLGLDISSFERGRLSVMDQVKKDSMDYVSFWEGALEKKDKAETAANEKSLAKLKALDDAKLAETERFFAAQKAMYEEQAAVASMGSLARYEKDAAGNLIPSGGWSVLKQTKDVEKAAVKGAAERGGTGAVNEFFVLIREGLRGTSPARIASSAMRLMSLLFDGMLGVAMYAVGVVGTAQGAAMLMEKLGIDRYKGKAFAGSQYLAVASPTEAYEAVAGAISGHKDEKAAEENAKKIYRERLDKMHKGGFITQQAFDYYGRLLGGGSDDLDKAIGLINRAGQTSNFDMFERMAKHAAAAKAAEQVSQEGYNARRKGFSDLHERLTFDTSRYNMLMSDPAATSKEIAEAWGNIADDNKKISEETQRQLEAEQKKTEETQKQVANLQAAAGAAVSRYNMHFQEQDQPTLADLAGRGYNARLALWKKYNLGTGGGPFGNIARDAERSQAMVQWNIEHGNAEFDDKGNLVGGNAFDWMKRQQRDVHMLRSAGLRDDPYAEMTQHLAAISAKLNKLGVTITGVDPGQQ